MYFVQSMFLNTYMCATCIPNVMLSPSSRTFKQPIPIAHPVSESRNRAFIELFECFASYTHFFVSVGAYQTIVYIQ